MPGSECHFIRCWQNKNNGSHPRYDTIPEALHQFCIQSNSKAVNIVQLTEVNRVPWAQEPFFQASLLDSFPSADATGIHTVHQQGLCVCIGTDLFNNLGVKLEIYSSIHLSNNQVLSNYSKSSLNTVDRFCNFKWNSISWTQFYHTLIDVNKS